MLTSIYLCTMEQPVGISDIPSSTQRQTHTQKLRQTDRRITLSNTQMHIHTPQHTLACTTYVTRTHKHYILFKSIMLQAC